METEDALERLLAKVNLLTQEAQVALESPCTVIQKQEEAKPLGRSLLFCVLEVYVIYITTCMVLGWTLLMQLFS